MQAVAEIVSRFENEYTSEPLYQIRELPVSESDITTKPAV